MDSMKIIYADALGYEVVNTCDWDNAKSYNGRAWKVYDIDPRRRLACMIPVDTLPSMAGSIVMQAMTKKEEA